MFDSDSLYSVSSQHWEDLENISLPSLPFQLQFPDTPLEDEADQSGMTLYIQSYNDQIEDNHLSQI